MIIGYYYKPEQLPEKVLHYGIHVGHWQIGKSLRIYVLIPWQIKNELFCSVHIVVEEVEFWSAFTNDLVETQLEESPVLPDHIEEALYAVWDDGAEEQMDKARLLYTYFQEQIFTEKPLLEKLTARDKEIERLEKIKIAKQKGWDTNLIT